MSSNILTRLATTSRGSRSFYEQLRADDEDRDGGSRDKQADEDNLRQPLDGLDLDQAEALIGDSRATISSVFEPAQKRTGVATRSLRTPRSGTVGGEPPHDDDMDNDVPASLLVEHHGQSALGGKSSSHRRMRQSFLPSDHREPSLQSQWIPKAPPAALRIDDESRLPSEATAPAPPPMSAPTELASASQKEWALWQWVNISNLDRFILEVYDYYEGSGMWCILSGRILRICETTFMLFLLTFLTQCVDYGKLHGSRSLSDVTIPHCTTHMSTLWSVGVWFSVFYILWKCVQFTLDIRRLFRIRAFFTHLLNIPEQDMQTVSWQDIVARVMALRDANPSTATNIPPKLRKFILGSQSKERLDAHDIANRLMRKDNYLIAMINKDMLDLSLPIPFLRQHQFFSQTLEWCLQFSILDFVFSPDGQVRQEFLKSSRRGVLSQKLRQRLVFAGILNLVFAPFVMAYLVIVYALTYYQEYQKNPSILGARRYTALAEWKFREFNELPHIFRERLNMSYPFANRYVTQFPKQMTEQIARTVAFVTGALAAVLAALTLQDAEFLNFEITADRTALFYLTILGGIWAMARNSVSEETEVFNPEYALRNVIEYTRYLPDHWKGRLHSAEVLREFSELYKLKWVVVLEELLGIVTAPCVLLLSLPKCSDQIVDFFREFTIHVDGLGYVCSFAVFDFRKTADETEQQAPRDVREDYYATKHGKMAASFYGFIDNYVVNPKTGIPGHTPPGVRPTFHPPPQFPGLNSPTMAADLQASRFGKGSVMERDHKTKARVPSGRFAPPFTQPSPMASMLLDPHHQPYSGARSSFKARQTRPQNPAEPHDHDEQGEPGGILGESVWEISPAKALSRESSGAAQPEDSDTGVLGLIYQLQQAQRPPRNARVL